MRSRTTRWLPVSAMLALIVLAVACSGDNGDPTAVPVATVRPTVAAETPESTPTSTPVKTSTARPVPTSAPAATAVPTRVPTATATATPEVPVTGIPIISATLTGPQSASAVAVTPDGRFIVAVNPDSDSVSIVNAESLELVAEVQVGDDPRTLAITPDGRHALVANHGGRSVSAVDLTTFEEITRWSVGPMPYGVVTDGQFVYITEFGSGTLRAIDLSSGEVAGIVEVGEFPTGLGFSPDRGQLFITHLFDGDLAIVEAATLRLEMTISTGADNNVSQFVAISADDKRAYLPQTRSNVSNTAMLFDNTVFPVVNVVDLDQSALVIRDRITLDTADKPVSLPFAVALTPNDERAFVVNAGSDQVSVIDLETNRAVSNLSVGANPRGIAISPDGGRAYVNNVLDGTLSVIDTGVLAVIETVKLTDIPLDPEILLGKQIFNSAADPVLSTDGWIACSSCHFDGGSDQRTWLGFPDGPRNTPALYGVGETLPIHWSGDLNELADVELTIRNIQFGTGLVGGDQLDSLGPVHAGLSVELDALAAYMDSLAAFPPPQETDPAVFIAGQKVFQEQQCSSCHAGDTFVDGEIHDVGTGDPALEKNSHGRGTAYDTPSLRGLWLTAPYLHDGTAPTLADVLRSGDTHAVADDLSDAEISDLVAYLLALPVSE